MFFLTILHITCSYGVSLEYLHAQFRKQKFVRFTGKVENDLTKTQKQPLHSIK